MKKSRKVGITPQEQGQKIRIHLNNVTGGTQVRKTIEKLSIAFQIDSENLASKLVEYQAREEHRVYTPNLIRREVLRGYHNNSTLNLTVSFGTALRVRKLSNHKSITEPEVYNNLLHYAVHRASRDTDWLMDVIKAVEPIEPWPNKIKKSYE
ncbi:hypothetical protein [Shewanella baltica]|uniref:hypothetical protein n=1 Tax=Shewanella baltica TaxID=62322 RepID=UPI003CFF6ECC